MTFPRTARRLAALVSIGAASLAPLPAAALADNGSSAGDQQYVDPLSGSSAPAASHPSSSGSGSASGSSSGSSAGTSAAPAATSSGSGSSAPAGTAAAGATGTTAGRTLPFTGYDGGLAVALGSGLVAGGVLLRRRLATTDR